MYATSDDSDANPVPVHLVREELARIEASATFRRTDQLRDLLRHVVERTLAGKTAHLKELAIGVEALRRPTATFDPRKDPIVRIEARRLRDKLARYYATEARDGLVEIDLPTGTYVPVFRRRARSLQTGVTIPSLIVLPVANLSGDPGNDAFCEGFTEELIDAFARLPGLRVIARSTAFRYRGQSGDVRQIGREVNAATLVEASVQRRAARIKVTAQLIQTRDGAHLWSRTFAADETEFFELQRSLAADIVAALQTCFAAHPAAERWTLAPRTLVRRGPSSAEAREFHDRGRAALHRLRASTQRVAIDLFRKAQAIDPHFALAHSGEAGAWTNLASFGAEPAATALPLARAAARRALALDGELHDALSVEAYVTLRLDRDFARAEQIYIEGIRLNPSAAYLRLGYAWLLAFCGRFDEAERQFGVVRELDPLDVGLRHNHAIFLFCRGRFAEAEAALRAVLEFEPDITSASVLAQLLALEGRSDDACEACDTLDRIAPGEPVSHYARAYVLGTFGQTDEARALASMLLAPDRPFAIEAALLTAAGGDRDAAFAALERAAGERHIAFVAVPLAPQLWSLHDDLRWGQMLARYGLPFVPRPDRVM